MFVKDPWNLVTVKNRDQDMIKGTKIYKYKLHINYAMLILGYFRTEFGIFLLYLQYRLISVDVTTSSLYVYYYFLPFSHEVYIYVQSAAKLQISASGVKMSK